MRRLTTTQLPLRYHGIRILALAATLVGMSAAWLDARRADGASLPALIRAGKLAAQLHNVPSHNRRFRASLLPARDAARDDVGNWTLRIQRANGARLPHAALVMQPWMPDEPAVRRDRPRVLDAGNGEYRVEGLRLDRSGWWNVRLGVTDSGITDSLAFNVIVP